MARGQELPVLELLIGLGAAGYAGFLGDSLKNQIRDIVDPILHPGPKAKAPPGTPDTPAAPTCAALVEGRAYKGSGPSVYLANNGVLRLVPSADDFNRMGLRWEGIHTISDACLTGYQHGEPIHAPSPPVTFALGSPPTLPIRYPGGITVAVGSGPMGPY